MRRFGLLIGALLLTATAIVFYVLGFYRQPAQEQRPEAQSVTLEFYQQREEAMAGFAAVIGRFHQQQPLIEVFQRNVPNTQELLVARIRSRDIPDLFTDWPTQLNFGAVEAEGIVVDLSGQAFLAGVSPQALAMVTRESGGVYALPLNYNCMEVFYNTKIFERMGLAVPETVDELLSVCDTLASGGVLPFVFPIRDYGRIAHVAQMLLATLVDDYLDQMDNIAAGRITPAGKDEILSAMRLMRTLYEFSQINGQAVYTYYEACEQFAAGNAAMMISGSYALNTINSFDTELSMDIFPFPGETADRQVMLSSIDTAICVAETSPYRQEALTFLSFLMEPDISQLYASMDMGPSCLTGVHQDNPIAQKMSAHIAAYPNANWLKSRFSLETVSLFSNAVSAYLLSGDEQTLWTTLETALQTN